MNQSLCVSIMRLLGRCARGPARVWTALAFPVPHAHYDSK
jgi:hypothetical protein